MADKKSTKKEEVKEEKYFKAVGRRKTAVARVRIYPVDKKKQGFVVNDKDIERYFSVARHKETASAPLQAVGQADNFDVTVKVAGGGVSAQAEAIRLGVARALVVFDDTLKKALRDNGYMTRDPRVVERKKPGLKKARRAPQWSKR